MSYPGTQNVHDSVTTSGNDRLNRGHGERRASNKMKRFVASMKSVASDFAKARKREHSDAISDRKQSHNGCTESQIASLESQELVHIARRNRFRALARQADDLNMWCLAWGLSAEHVKALPRVLCA